MVKYRVGGKKLKDILTFDPNDPNHITGKQCPYCNKHTDYMNTAHLNHDLRLTRLQHGNILGCIHCNLVTHIFLVNGVFYIELPVNVEALVYPEGIEYEPIE